MSDCVACRACSLVLNCRPAVFVAVTVTAFPSVQRADSSTASVSHHFRGQAASGQFIKLLFCATYSLAKLACCAKGSIWPPAQSWDRRPGQCTLLFGPVHAWLFLTQPVLRDADQFFNDKPPFFGFTVKIAFHATLRGSSKKHYHQSLSP